MAQPTHHPDPKAEAITPPLQNVNVARVQPLISPLELDRQVAAGFKSRSTVYEGRQTIQRILAREDPRMLVIVGPCSIHDPRAALEYAERLVELRRQVGDRLELVMRVYFEKPRTTVGWKGLINDPHLNQTLDLDAGLRIARQLLVSITEMALPTATEMLDPFTPQYIDDLVCWAAIGARTTESQTHRQMASGLSMPVGYKNSTEGSVQVAMEAMQAAGQPHAFLGIDELGNAAVVTTRGNSWGHVILRGGREGANFHPDDVAAAVAMLDQAGLSTSLMIDCSHANSGKRFEQQQVAWRSVIEQRVAGNANLVGLMIESNLFEGNQKLRDDPAQLKYGVSITDACIGWDQTRELVHWAYEQLA